MSSENPSQPAHGSHMDLRLVDVRVTEILRIIDLIAPLVARRTALGISQDALAKRMGTSQSVLARLERGTSEPKLLTLDRYARALGSSLRVELR